MLIVLPDNKTQIKETITLIESLKKSPEAGLIVYTVPACKVKAKFLKAKDSIKAEEDSYLVLIDWAVYVPSMEDSNDSPGSKPITKEEHFINCDKIISELRIMGELA